MLSTAYIRSPLGPLFISLSDTYISEISFVNSFKGVTVNEESIDFTESDNEIIKECKKQLEQYFTGERKEFTIPIKIGGSDFQNGVWNKLMEIPYGRTISYMQLSKQVDNIKAIRAVGSANGSNKIVIVVPCHRVIGSNGSLVGYGGDLWRKRWLLDHEAKYANGVRTLF